MVNNRPANASKLKKMLLCSCKAVDITASEGWVGPFPKVRARENEALSAAEDVE